MTNTFLCGERSNVYFAQNKSYYSIIAPNGMIEAI